jgi:hypothetical protein
MPSRISAWARGLVSLHVPLVLPHYATLGLPHELAIAEQELAEAYLHLNLVEAAAALGIARAPGNGPFFVYLPSLDR